MTTDILDILLYAIPAILMILVTQLTRCIFVRYDRYDNGCTGYNIEQPAICNGVRWLLILVALIPIINILTLITECCIIAYKIEWGEIKVRGGDESQFLKWWRK